MSGAIRTLPVMSGTLIGYARCSTDDQDLTAQRQGLAELGVPASGPTPTTASRGPTANAPVWTRPWPPCAKATRWSCRNSTGLPGRCPSPAYRGRAGRPWHHVGARQESLCTGRPDGKNVLQHLGHLRRIRGGPDPPANPRRHGVARAKGKLRGHQPKLLARQQAELLAACTPPASPPDRRPRRAVQRLPRHRLPHPPAIPRQQTRPGNRIGRHLAPRTASRVPGSPQPERYRYFLRGSYPDPEKAATVSAVAPGPGLAGDARHDPR